jgi:membrane protein required for colicin V production
MWLDAIAIAVLVLFVLVGAARGGLASFLSLVSLGAAYGAAIAAAPRFGPFLATPLGLPEVLGLPIAGCLAFLVTYLVMGALSTAVRRVERRRRGVGRSARDRFLGAVFGVARGALVVLLLSWLALWVDALRATGTAPALPELGPSAAAAVTETVVEAGVEAALSDAGSARRVVANAASRPRRVVVGLQAVLEHPLVEDLRDDALFWTYVEHGSVDSALNRSSFIRISRDEALRQQLAQVGLVEEAAAADSRAFREAVDPMLREVGSRIRGLREDPELRGLLEDPELVVMLQSGNTLGLMNHSGFRQLVARVTAPSE